MTEQDQSTSHSGDSHDPNKADSAFNSEEVKQDGPVRDVGGGIANELGVGSEETGQQALEKSRTAGSDTSQRDPKLVHLCCLPFLAE
jgi:hypothetical protein